MKTDITYKCSMNCSHCLSNCDEHGQHMTLDTFDKVVQFHKKYQPKFIILTGGEIFEHPNIREILQKASANFEMVMLLTNGLKLATDEDLFSFVQQLRNSHGVDNFKIQVTNDERYYPKNISSYHKNLLKKLAYRKLKRLLGFILKVGR